MLGIRPEHFEDAKLVDESVRAAGATFTEKVDVVEEMASDKYVYFTARGDRVSTAELDELAADNGTAEVPTDEGRLVTGLSVESSVRENQQAEVGFDPEELHIFDPESGRTFT